MVDYPEVTKISWESDVEEEYPKTFRYSSVDKEAVWSGDRAKQAHTITKGVEVGTWADRVIATFPKSEMLCEPIILGRDTDVPEGVLGLVVCWRYAEFDLILARGYNRFPKVEVYAVQAILFKGELKAHQEALHDKWTGFIETAVEWIQRRDTRNKARRYFQ